MSDITTRSGKGSPLTNDEVDANFTNLNTDKLESGDLSVVTTAVGTAALAYNSGVFTYTPPDLTDIDLSLYAPLAGATFTGPVIAPTFEGSLDGNQLFKAKAGEAITKGHPVYISGISGNTPIVMEADADDPTKMPAFGLASDTVAINAAVNVVTYGQIHGLDTTPYALGAPMYVSTTPGGLSATAPTGESSLIQNMGKVERVHATAGTIFVAGAGRTNATPNLNNGNFFLGNASNQSVSADFSAEVATQLAGTVVLGDVSTTGSVEIDGDLTVNGTTVTINATELALEDNMIYLNEGSAVLNPDLGIAGGYNDGTYAHAGIFRDATDGVWKIYDGYTLEPDASAYIDITHASFTLSDMQVNTLYADGGNSTNWNTAYGWGDHSLAGYLTSYVDTNTTYTAGTGLSLDGTVFSNSAPDQTVTLTGGGATAVTGTYPDFTVTSTDTVYTHPTSHSISFITGLQTALDEKVDDSQVLTNVPAGAVFTDTVYTLPFTDYSTNWNTAYDWGDHSQAGYLPLTGGTVTGTTTFTDSIEMAYSVGNTFNLLCNNTGFQTLNIASNNLDAGVDKYIYIGKNTGSNAGNSTFIELGDDASGSLVKAFGNFQATGTVTATGGTLTGKLNSSNGFEIFYDDHASGPIWDTFVYLGKVDEASNHGDVAPVFQADGSYGMLLQANSDGMFVGLEQTTTGNYNPVIKWGDDHTAGEDLFFRHADNTYVAKMTYNSFIVNGVLYATDGNSGQWNTAYGWGNHASAGYLTSYTDTNTTYSAGTGISLSGTTFSLTDTNAKLNLSGGTLTGALKLEGGSYSSGADTATVALAVDRNDYIYSDDGTYLRRILGHTAGGAVEIGQNGTGLINSVNLLTGNSGNSAAKVNGNTIWNAGNDGPDSGLDADTVDGWHKSDFTHAEGSKTWSVISASGTQARRYKVARLYGCPAHWDANWQNIEFHVTAESFESGSLKFKLMGDATGAGSQANMIKIYLKEVDGPLAGRFRFVLGTPVDAGWDHSGQDTFYVDLYAEASYYSDWKIQAKTFGHGILNSNPTSGGAATVFYDSPIASNTDDFNVSNSDTYTRGYKIWNELNDGPGSGLDADLLDNQQGSYYLNTSTKLFKSGAEIAGSRDLNTYRVTGYYSQDSNADATSGSNYPVLAAGILEVITGDQGNNLQTEQRYSQYNNNDKYVRHYYNGNWTAWAKQWNSANDGPDSGLNADLLDGQHGSYYAPNSALSSYLPLSGGTMTGTLDLGTQNIAVDSTKGFVNSGSWTRNQTPYGYIDFGPANDGWAHIYTDRPAFYFNKELYVNSARVFHDSFHPNADKWTTARTLTLNGDVTGSVSWDGSANATLTAAVGDDSHSHSQVFIPDTRGAQRAPSYYPDKNVSFDFQNNADTLAGGDSWNVLQTVAPWSIYDATHRQQQLAWTGTGGLKFRYATSESAWAEWQTLWTSGNDGPDSGLNADLLDGWEGSSYVNTSGTQSIGGGKSFGNILTVDGGQTGGYPLQRLTSSSVSTYSRIEFGYTGQVSRGKLQYNNTGDSMAFWTATAERARITSAGDILVNKTASNTTVVGNEIKASGNIYATQDYPALSSQLLLRNNSSTDSLVGLGCYNGISNISTTSSTGGGHSLSISGGMSGEYARFTSAKRLGIGTTAPVESLHVVGNIVATGNITAYISDERLKDLKGTIPNALYKVSQLNGYYYTANETAQALGIDNKGLEVGISAQEVEAVLPEIVTKSAIGDDYKTVWYEKLTPLLIEAVKELTEKVDKLETRLTELEK